VIARVAAATLLLLVGGCTTLPPAGGMEDWPARRAALQSLEAWTLDGRIAVAAGVDGFSGGFDWVQRGERADIEVSGPMGGSAMSIRVEGDQAIVSIRGEDVADEGAEPLLSRYFGPGRSLPVAEMRYWLVGAPAPGAPHEESLGEDRRLAQLSQSGWRVRYDRYEPVGSLALPARMEMTTEGLRLRVVVSDWRLPP
jgi:outer membrane lipoprotein LolB